MVTQPSDNDSNLVHYLPKPLPVVPDGSGENGLGFIRCSASLLLIYQVCNRLFKRQKTFTLNKNKMDSSCHTMNSMKSTAFINNFISGSGIKITQIGLNKSQRDEEDAKLNKLGFKE